MKKSISYWSLEGGLEGTRPIREAFEEAKAAKFDGLELAVGETGVLTPETTEAECKEILKLSKQIGVAIPSLCTGLYWSYSLTSSDPAEVKKAKDLTKKMLQVTKWLKAEALLVIPGWVGVDFIPGCEVVPYDVAYQRATSAIRSLVPTAEKLKVTMAIEYVWNKFLLSPLEFRAFLDQFKSRYVKAYFDVGNVLLTGYPEQWIRILGKRIKKVHFKDFKRSVGTIDGFCDLLEGDVDFKAVMAAFRAVGYDGYATAEMMPPAPGLLKKTSKAMSKVFKM